jgi:Transposase DDE domain group 1
VSHRRDRRDAQLQAEATAIRERLANAVGPNPGGPLLGRVSITYGLSERVKATAHGGLGVIARIVNSTGLAAEIDRSVELLKAHRPYHESDHVLNLAYNALCGGQRLDSIELRRGDRVLLDGLGVASLPDPTTAGDFCRRFDAATVDALQDAINRARVKVWQRQPQSFFEQTAVIDADASLVTTDGETKEGMDLSYKGTWGYSALVVSLANTQEPLYLALHGANRPSHEGAVGYYDKAIALCRLAGYKKIRLRGDTDFSLTAELDRWDDDNVTFVFGYDAYANLVQRAETADQDTYHQLVARAEKQIEADRQRRRGRVLRTSRRRSSAPASSRTSVSSPRTSSSSPTAQGTATVTTESSRCARTFQTSAARACCLPSTATSSTSPTTARSPLMR